MLRTAIIGYGAIAVSHVTDIRFFSADSPLRCEDDPVVELVAACDLREEARRKFEAETGGQAFETMEEMLDRVRPDYVHVCTCADAHVGPVLACAQRGIHVLCEKPMATEPAECDTMIAACERAGVQFVISHQRRTDPLHWYGKHLVREGLIGDLQFITGGAGPRRGGKELHNIGSHLLDAVGIFGGPAQWVWGFCSIEGRPCTVEDREPGDRGSGWVLGERVDVSVGYAGAVTSHFRFGPDGTGFFWLLRGTGGCLAMFERELWHTEAPEPSPTRAWRRVEPEAIAVTTDSGYANPPGWVETAQALPPYPRVFMMREMFQRMQSGGDHTSSGRIGSQPLEIIQGTFLSHLSGERVSLPAAQRHSPLVS
jgi:predicted dehydrogenase